MPYYNSQTTICSNCNNTKENKKKRCCNKCLERSRIWGFNKKHNDKNIEIVNMSGKYVVILNGEQLEYKGTRILFYIKDVWKGNFLDTIQ